VLDSRVVKKSAAHLAAKVIDTSKECMICAEKKTNRSFTNLETGSCAHFNAICNRCVGSMIKEKIAERKLDEAVLVCPVPQCEVTLDHLALQKVLTKAQFGV
jgi:hypothetical protein